MRGQLSAAVGGQCEDNSIMAAGGQGQHKVMGSTAKDNSNKDNEEDRITGRNSKEHKVNRDTYRATV